MPARTATAKWTKGLRDGHGTVALGSGAYEGQYSFQSRFEEGVGTNPEELLGAAHAGCFSMALSAGLEGAGFSPESVETAAKVHLEKADAGFAIGKIVLTTTAVVPGIDDATFQELAQTAKAGCPISKALAATEIQLTATLAG